MWLLIHVHRLIVTSVSFIIHFSFLIVVGSFLSCVCLCDSVMSLFQVSSPPNLCDYYRDVRHLRLIVCLSVLSIHTSLHPKSNTFLNMNLTHLLNNFKTYDFCHSSALPHPPCQAPSWSNSPVSILLNCSHSPHLVPIIYTSFPYSCICWIVLFPPEAFSVPACLPALSITCTWIITCLGGFMYIVYSQSC